MFLCYVGTKAIYMRIKETIIYIILYWKWEKRSPQGRTFYFKKKQTLGEYVFLRIVEDVFFVFFLFLFPTNNDNVV